MRSATASVCGLGFYELYLNGTKAGDRVLAGLRDLKHLYVRANSCVACHQTVEPALLAAGHPELLFELDGQAVAEPKHWREKGDWHGPKAWLVGQAVVVAGASSGEAGKSGSAKGYNVAAAAEVGKLIASRAIEKGVRQVVFDRGGYLYHGRVKALAEAAREGGLEF